MDADMDDGAGEGEGREGMKPPPPSSVVMAIFKIVIIRGKCVG